MQRYRYFRALDRLGHLEWARVGSDKRGPSWSKRNSPISDFKASSHPQTSSSATSLRAEVFIVASQKECEQSARDVLRVTQRFPPLTMVTLLMTASQGSTKLVRLSSDDRTIHNPTARSLNAVGLDIPVFSRELRGFLIICEIPRLSLLPFIHVIAPKVGRFSSTFCGFSTFLRHKLTLLHLSSACIEGISITAYQAISRQRYLTHSCETSPMLQIEQISYEST